MGTGNYNITPLFTGINERTTQKHGHRKRKTAREMIKSYVLKQMYFNVNDENSTAWKYFDFRTSAAWLFRKVNSCLRMAKYGRNM
jgi:hypothetical protein